MEARLLLLFSRLLFMVYEYCIRFQNCVDALDKSEAFAPLPRQRTFSLLRLGLLASKPLRLPNTSFCTMSLVYLNTSAPGSASNAPGAPLGT